MLSWQCDQRKKINTQIYKIVDKENIRAMKLMGFGIIIKGIYAFGFNIKMLYFRVYFWNCLSLTY